jgi:hypothetical protein
MSSAAGGQSRTVLFFSLAALAALSTAVSAWATEPPNSKDLMIGDWALQLDKSKFCDAARTPKQSLRKVRDEGFGMISVHWTGMEADGTPINRMYVYFNNGTKVPAGEFRETPLKDKESMTFHLLNPHRLVWEHWSADNKLTGNWVREVSADGQTMTQTDKLLNRPGCVDVEVYQRQ